MWAISWRFFKRETAESIRTFGGSRNPFKILSRWVGKFLVWSCAMMSASVLDGNGSPFQTWCVRGSSDVFWRVPQLLRKKITALEVEVEICQQNHWRFFWQRIEATELRWFPHFHGKLPIHQFRHLDHFRVVRPHRIQLSKWTVSYVWCFGQVSKPLAFQKSYRNSNITSKFVWWHKKCLHVFWRFVLFNLIDAEVTC